MECLSSAHHGNAEIHMCTNLFCVDLFNTYVEIGIFIGSYCSGGEDQGAAHV